MHRIEVGVVEIEHLHTSSPYSGNTLIGIAIKLILQSLPHHWHSEIGALAWNLLAGMCIQGLEYAAIHRQLGIGLILVVARGVVELGQFTLGYIVFGLQLQIHQVVGIVAVLPCRGRRNVPSRLVGSEQVAVFLLINRKHNIVGEAAALL